MRGSVLDTAIAVIMIFGFFVTGAVYLYMNSQISTKFETELLAAGAPSAEITEIFDNVADARAAFSSGLTFLIFALMVFVLFLSYMVKQHPAFIIFAVIILAVTILITLTLKTAWDKLVDAVPAFATQISISSWFWNNVLAIIAVWGMLNIFLMYYSATRAEGG